MVFKSGNTIELHNDATDTQKSRAEKKVLDSWSEDESPTSLQTENNYITSDLISE